MNWTFTVVTAPTLGPAIGAAVGAAWAVFSVIVGLCMPSRPGKARNHSSSDVGE